MVFAFNCVTVFMILIELVRYFFKEDVPFIKNTFETYFKSFCDSREQAPHALIITHIFLLIGCSLPVNITFIFTNGGFFNEYWLLLSLSGIVFLGVGDSFVKFFFLKLIYYRLLYLGKDLARPDGADITTRQQKDQPI